MNLFQEQATTKLPNERKVNLQNLLIKSGNTKNLTKPFFNVSCSDLATNLLGKLLVHKTDNDIILKGRIVETECYPGGLDKASHSYNGRRTTTNEPMYMEAGTAYIYIIYGIYHCFNISSVEQGGWVLIRALEPVEGTDKMVDLRSVRKKNAVKLQDLCKGPSNLCISMNITKGNCNKIDLSDSLKLWVEKDESFTDEFEIVKTSRIGISSKYEEWTNVPFRYYVKGNSFVSKRDKRKEKEMDKTL